MIKLLDSQILEQLRAQQNAFTNEIIPGSRDHWSIYNEGRADGIRMALKMIETVDENGRAKSITD